MNDLFVVDLKKKEVKFREFLERLIAVNPFYKMVSLKEGFDVRGDNIIDIYSSLPIIKKKDILELKKEYFSYTDEKIYSEITSGSTGQILNCKKTASERGELALNIWKQRRKLDPLVNIDNFIDLFSDEVEDIIGRFYEVSEESVVSNFHKIMKLKPRWLSGPISLINKFAYMIRDEKVQFTNDGTLKFIELTGEYNDTNKVNLIRDIFQCQVIDYYGTRETWCIAYSCLEGGMHIQDYMLVDTEKENDYSKVLLTSMINRYMPFIKYDIGDRGRLIEEKCKCGKEQLLLKLDGGRVTDVITGSNLLGNYFFDQVVWDACVVCDTPICEIQVVQVELHFFVFYIVKSLNYNKIVEDVIRIRLKKELGINTAVEFKYVDKLKPLKNGKVKKFYPYMMT